MDQSDLMFVRDVLDSVLTGNVIDTDVINALDMIESQIVDVPEVEASTDDEAS